MMARKNRSIQARIEYAEIDATRKARRRPVKARPPAPSDPEAVDTSQHDDFVWSVYEMRGLYAFHPQDKRMKVHERMMLRFAFWAIHNWRKA
jgi:hypothetical protein